MKFMRGLEYISLLNYTVLFQQILTHIHQQEKEHNNQG